MGNYRIVKRGDGLYYVQQEESIMYSPVLEKIVTAWRDAGLHGFLASVLGRGDGFFTLHGAERALARLKAEDVAYKAATEIVEVFDGY